MPDIPRAGVEVYPHPLIAREGWYFIAISFAIALTVTVFAGWQWACVPWLISAFVLQFFRDPPRDIPSEPGAVLSPADGRVVTVERALDPFLQRDAVLVSVFMNVFNVHSNRSPVDGEVREVWYRRGKFLNAALQKASSENECNALWIKTPQGGDLTCVQVAGLIARRILCYVKAGESIKRGQRYGFIRFGSRLDVYLPLTAVPKVSVGDKVHASSTILAHLS